MEWGAQVERRRREYRGAAGAEYRGAVGAEGSGVWGEGVPLPNGGGVWGGPRKIFNFLAENSAF